MPLQDIVLESFLCGNMNLRKGKTVELKNGDFLRIRQITQLYSTEVVLQGLMFQRVYKLGGFITKHANEVCWVEEMFLDESAEDEEVPMAEVVRIRQLRMTNSAYDVLNVKHTMPWPPSNTLYRTEGILFCRIKYEVVFTGHAQKAKNNSFSFVEKCVRNLQSEETDGKFWEDPAHLRARFRGEPSSTERSRRSVSTTTLVGNPDIDDALQVISNPATLHKSYTFGDVFCGGGGVSCGAARAGLVVRWGLDCAMDAMRTYQLNFTDAVCECTLVEHFLNSSIYPSDRYVVDVLHLSPPCQPFSPAQTCKPENFEDIQVVILCVNELVKKVKPRVITMEETFGLLHEMNRDFFKSVINSLVEQGYSVRWKIMNFVEYGVPQARRRLILIAAAPGETIPRFPEPTHLDNPTTIASIISTIPPNAPNHNARDYPIPKLAYDANGLLKSLIATAGGDDNYHPSGKRPFTARELGCLQTFPLDYKFVGTKTAVVKQIGNAVPPLAAMRIYEEIIRTLRKTDAGA